MIRAGTNRFRQQQRRRFVGNVAPQFSKSPTSSAWPISMYLGHHLGETMPRFTGRPTSAAWPIATYLGTPMTQTPAQIAQQQREMEIRAARIETYLGPIYERVMQGGVASTVERYALYHAGLWPTPAGTDERDRSLYVTLDGVVVSTYMEPRLGPGPTGGAQMVSTMAVPAGSVPKWSLDYPSPIPQGMHPRTWLEGVMQQIEAGTLPAAPATPFATPDPDEFLSTAPPAQYPVFTPVELPAPQAAEKPAGINPLIFVGLGLKLLGIL